MMITCSVCNRVFRSSDIVDVWGPRINACRPVCRDCLEVEKPKLSQEGSAGAGCAIVIMVACAFIAGLALGFLLWH